MKYQTLDTSNFKDYQTALNLDVLAAKILASKNLSIEAAKALMEDVPLYDVKQLPMCKSILDHFKLVKDLKRRVLICGDYDCDGFCATAIMYNALKNFGVLTTFEIPDRIIDGYGLNTRIVDIANSKRCTTIVCVDNGVKAFEAINYAKSLGISVIVVDHHAIEKEVECDILLHPSILDEQLQNLCGAGLAYLVAQILGTETDLHLILAGIATIADVVSITNQNRTYVKEAIKLLDEGKALPIQMLMNDRKEIDEDKIAFQIVPKLNSTGRLSDKLIANNTPKYLINQNKENIEAYATKITNLNEYRKNLTTRTLTTAKKQCNDDSFQVIYDADFHEGLIGLIAGRLCNDYYKPVAVFTRNKNILKGSIRSVKGVDLRNFFEDYDHDILAYGGHELAAGIAIKATDLTPLKKYIKTKMATLTPPEAKLDCIKIESDELTFDSINSLKTLRPFGQDFKLPLFLVTIKVASVLTLSNGAHLKLVSDEGIEVLYFHQGDRKEEFAEGDEVTVLAKASINEFRGNMKINLMVEEIIKA
ncbi:MAG: DHH family phosphoesterase [Erysipelotrichaceae bacterium]